MTESGLIGIVVDQVDEIVNISANDVEASPQFGGDTKYILAMAKIKDNVNILLDVDKVVGHTAHALQ
jgi:purine-binding chemotaxis protein CheW